MRENYTFIQTKKINIYHRMGEEEQLHHWGHVIAIATSAMHIHLSSEIFN